MLSHLIFVEQLENLFKKPRGHFLKNGGPDATNRDFWTGRLYTAARGFPQGSKAVLDCHARLACFYVAGGLSLRSA